MLGFVGMSGSESGEEAMLEMGSSKINMRNLGRWVSVRGAGPRRVLLVPTEHVPGIVHLFNSDHHLPVGGRRTTYTT